MHHNQQQDRPSAPTGNNPRGGGPSNRGRRWNNKPRNTYRKNNDRDELFNRSNLKSNENGKENNRDFGGNSQGDGNFGDGNQGNEKRGSEDGRRRDEWKFKSQDVRNDKRASSPRRNNNFRDEPRNSRRSENGYRDNSPHGSFRSQEVRNEQRRDHSPPRNNNNFRDEPRNSRRVENRYRDNSPHGSFRRQDVRKEQRRHRSPPRNNHTNFRNQSDNSRRVENGYRDNSPRGSFHSPDSYRSNVRSPVQEYRDYSPQRYDDRSGRSDDRRGQGYSDRDRRDYTPPRNRNERSPPREYSRQDNRQDSRRDDDFRRPYSPQRNDSRNSYHYRSDDRRSTQGYSPPRNDNYRNHYNRGSYDTTDYSSRGSNNSRERGQRDRDFTPPRNNNRQNDTRDNYRSPTPRGNSPRRSRSRTPPASRNGASSPDLEAEIWDLPRSNTDHHEPRNRSPSPRGSYRQSPSPRRYQDQPRSAPGPSTSHHGHRSRSPQRRNRGNRGNRGNNWRGPAGSQRQNIPRHQNQNSPLPQRPRSPVLNIPPSSDLQAQSPEPAGPILPSISDSQVVESQNPRSSSLESYDLPSRGSSASSQNSNSSEYRTYVRFQRLAILNAPISLSEEEEIEGEEVSDTGVLTDEIYEELRNELMQPLPVFAARGQFGGGRGGLVRQIRRPIRRPITSEVTRNPGEMRGNRNWTDRLPGPPIDVRDLQSTQPSLSNITKLTRSLVPKSYIGKQLRNNCIYCDRKHKPDECPFVVDVNHRRSILVNGKHCLRCIRIHPPLQCTKMGTNGFECGYCFDMNPNDLHHSSICPHALTPNVVD